MGNRGPQAQICQLDKRRQFIRSINQKKYQDIIINKVNNIHFIYDPEQRKVRDREGGRGMSPPRNTNWVFFLLIIETA